METIPYVIGISVEMFMDTNDMNTHYSACSILNLSDGFGRESKPIGI